MANAKKWSLSNIEYGKSSGKGTRSTLCTHIAKILPLVPFGKPKETKVILNKSCIINDNSCKPKVASQISTLNYMTLPCQSRIDGKLIKYGRKVRVEVRDGSPDQITVTGVE